MQVDDPGQFMRATLNALHYLVNLRGMQQLVRAADTDVHKWLQRRTQFERLEEPVFCKVARHFVVVSLRHSQRTDFANPAGEKRALMRKRQAQRARNKRQRMREAQAPAPATPDADELDPADSSASAVSEDSSSSSSSSDEETSDERNERRAHNTVVLGAANLNDANRVLFSIDGVVLRMERVCESAREFVPRSEPLLLGSNVPLAQRVHAAADYHIVLLVHTGFSTAQFNEARQRAQALVCKERQKRASAFGATASDKLRGHVFFVLWGKDFHPQSGKHYKRVQRTLRTLNDNSVKTDNVTYEAWSVHELQFDFTDQERVPTHRALTREQAIACEPLLGKIPLSEHRRILDTDPQARAHGFRAGQLLRIERADIKLAGRAVSYAAVARAEL